MKLALALLTIAILPGAAIAGTTCMDTGGGMVTCQDDDGSKYTGMNMGGDMTTRSEQTRVPDVDSPYGGTRSVPTQTCNRIGARTVCN
jgi:hypothetical protein